MYVQEASEQHRPPQQPTLAFIDLHNACPHHRAAAHPPTLASAANRTRSSSAILAGSTLRLPIGATPRGHLRNRRSRRTSARKSPAAQIGSCNALEKSAWIDGKIDLKTCGRGRFSRVVVIVAVCGVWSLDCLAGEVVRWTAFCFERDCGGVAKDEGRKIGKIYSYR